MDRTQLTNLSLCSGTGMLDVGLHLATRCRTLLHIERDSHAAAVLLARMEEQTLEPAPIWCGNLEEFDGRGFRGVVDCISAGFPCQPWSTAGRRGGHDDERWIWPDIVRIIREVEPWALWLENVPGLVRGGGLASVLGDLAVLGFDAEWGALSARDVGASHQRERVFILAYASRLPGGERARWQRLFDGRARVGDADGATGERERDRGELPGTSAADEGVDGQRQRIGGAVGPTGPAMVDANSARWQTTGSGRSLDDARELEQRRGGVADPERDRRPKHQRTQGEPVAADRVAELADTEYQGREGPGLTDQARRHELESCGGDGRVYAYAGDRDPAAWPVFAPGPEDWRWPDVLSVFPELAPALESKVRGVVDGLANGLVVDISLDVEEKQHPQTRPAQRVATWKKLLRLRLHQITGAASSGLQQTRRSSDPLSSMPQGTRQGRRDMECESSAVGELRDMRLELSAEETAQLYDMFRFGVSGRTGTNQREQAMASRADRLRCIGNGVSPLQAAAAFVLLNRRMM